MGNARSISLIIASASLMLISGCVSNPSRTGIHFKVGVGGILASIVDVGVECDVSTSKQAGFVNAFPEGEHKCDLSCVLFGCPKNEIVEEELQ